LRSLSLLPPKINAQGDDSGSGSACKASTRFCNSMRAHAFRFELRGWRGHADAIRDVVRTGVQFADTCNVQRSRDMTFKESPNYGLNKVRATSSSGGLRICEKTGFTSNPVQAKMNQSAPRCGIILTYELDWDTFGSNCSTGSSSSKLNERISSNNSNRAV